jgi:hypothetical protein
MSRSTSRVLGAVVLSLAAAVLAPAPAAQAGTVYWDINGTAGGAGGTIPNGTRDTTSTFWNTDSTGGSGGTLAAWSAGDTAVFAAGTDATGSYTVKLPNSTTTNVGGLTVEEGGTVTISSVTNTTTLAAVPVLAITAPTATIDVPAGKTLKFTNTFLDIGGSSTLTIQGSGTVDYQVTNSAPSYNGFTGNGSLIVTGGILIKSAWFKTSRLWVTVSTDGVAVGVDGRQWMGSSRPSQAAARAGRWNRWKPSSSSQCA